MSFLQKVYVLGFAPIAVIGLMYIPVLGGKLSKVSFYKYAFLFINTVFPNICNTGRNRQQAEMPGWSARTFDDECGRNVCRRCGCIYRTICVCLHAPTCARRNLRARRDVPAGWITHLCAHAPTNTPTNTPTRALPLPQ